MAKIYRNGRGSLSLVITGLVVTLLFLGLVSLIAWQRRGIPTFDEERRELRLKNLTDLNADNEKALNHYRWIDRQKGVVGIPIDRAKALIIADLEHNQPHPAGPINPPAQAPAPAAAPAPAGNGNANPAASGSPAPAPAANPAASPSPAAGVPPAAPAPGPGAPPAPIANPQSAPAPAPASTPAPSPAPASTPAPPPAPSPSPTGSDASK